jgi:4-hydroxybenzoate polyprenyltransferase
MTKINRNNVLVLLAVLRPNHWIKNLFVFAPLVFSGLFVQINMCLNTLVVFISFCMASGSVYIINDICDRHEDRHHPMKKFRPIASGAITPNTAILLSTILIVLGLVIASFLNRFVFYTVLLYILINIAYSLVIKHIAILDVMAISAGFVLRIIGGGMSISVVPSYWLILCTVMISMFLGFTKRRVELISVNTKQNNFRPVLKDYSISFLDQVIPMVTGATILAYALYTVDKHTLMVLGTRAMLLTLPFVIYGLLRYIYIIYHLKQCDDPTETLIHDVPTIINLFLWVIVSLLVVKYGVGFNYFQ